MDADFAIVGAGYTGLTAALRLTQGGHSVIVLEARDRVGGRSYTEDLGDNAWIDRGGAWFGAGHERAHGLAQEMGVGTYPTYAEGEGLYMNKGEPKRYKGTVPLRMGLFALANVGAALAWLDSAAKKVPVDEPWAARDAADLDARTVGQWLNSSTHVPSGTARRMLDMLMTDLFAADSSEVSMLYLLWLIRSHEDTTHLTGIVGGDQQDRVVGGTQSILNRIHAKLGDSVRLASPVREIKQRGSDIEVLGTDVSVRARRVIVAVPPSLAGYIDYQPLLPIDRVMLNARMPAGPMYKIALVYDDAWWRADGLTGQSLDLNSPVGLTLDACAQVAPPGILNAFIAGTAARKLTSLTEAERRKIVTDTVAQRFGPRGAAVQQYVEQEWGAERWTRGCSMGHCPPGALTQFGPTLREPSGRIHWASSETSAVTLGGIDGAIRSGERVAQEVVIAEAEGIATKRAA